MLLTLGGEEANPWVDLFITYFGHIGILIPKTFALVPLGIVVYRFWDSLKPTWQRGITNILYGITAGFVLVNCYSFGLLLLVS